MPIENVKQKLIHLVFVAVFAGLFYLNSFSNFFVWNDWTLIIENFLIKDWRNLPEIFSSAFWKPLLGEPFQIYRPLVSLSFMADFDLWRLNPFGYHLTNVSLHVLNSLLAYFLARRYVSALTALITALFFAVHPIHTEAVTYISGRGELLMSFFLLGGTLLFLQSGKRRSWPLYAASLPFFFFSLLAKETAAIFPLWLWVADLTAFASTQPSVPSRLLARQLGPLLVLGLYFVLRQYFVGMARADLASLPPDFVHHILLVLKAVSLYTFLILFPWNLHFLHPLDPSFSPTDLQFLFSILLLGGAGWGLRRALDSGKREIVFALLWFLVGLLPLVHFTAWRRPLLEGWLYLPSVGFFLLVALALTRLQSWGQSRLHIWTALFIVTLLGAATFNRNWDWKDEFEISRHTIARSPDDPVAVQLMGDAYMRRGKTLDAEKMFQKGLLLAPDDPSIHASLEWFFRFVGKDPEALIHYRKIIELRPKEPYPYWLLGRYYRGLGQFSEAEKYFSEAVRLFPYSSELRNHLAYMYFQQGKYDVAESELRAALKILPYSPVLQSNLDEVLRKKR